ncbi:hypothetical protein F5B22DRAFT_196141 [Xylaria bambusicola]|uniref:uncharacterized protein n=1 Tax=Xylaria bambusicola TaxID=326684 RepID=UPI0020072B2A|nr:uncharacterized protein F5B22DRAFT_196141 [Xylaria bambusicola]KAI0515280.1 hypothetical protein F5B22DRAFT_196141 [Xylaria bambusicola]
MEEKLEMDPVEKLFSSLADPEGSSVTDSVNAGNKLTAALEEFINGPPSKDSDYQYLLNHAQKAFIKGVSTVTYFRQQLAHLAAQKPIPRKDKSFKARQLRYHRWFAYGMKTETYPFEKRKPAGPASNARIAARVSPRACAACGRPDANMRCSDCSLSDDGHILEKTAYCNKMCLENDYKAHKKTCDCRRMVLRAASLMDNMFRAMQEATYIYALGKVYKKDGMVYLLDNNWDRVGITGRRLFVPFPKGVADNKEMRLALLYWAQSEEVTLSLFFLIKTIFKPVCKNVELVHVQPRNVITPICQMTAGRALNVCLYRHTVLKLTLMSDEQYVLDLSAAQFGWRETLAPWTAWTELRAAGMDEPKALKPSGSKISPTVQQSVLEAHQQDFRMTLMEAVVKELHSLRDLGKKLKADQHEFGRTEFEIRAMMRHKIFLLIKDECRKDKYRLWVCGAPNFNVRIAGELEDVLKELWISPKEYDRLKGNGTDMQKWWIDHIDGKIKETVDSAGVTIVTGASSNPANVQNLTCRKK